MKNILFIFILVFLADISTAHRVRWDADKKEWTELMKAVGKKQHKKIDKLLLDSLCQINYLSRYGNTALKIAIRNKDLKTVNKLINTGNLNVAWDSIGTTALMTAAQFKDLEVFKVVFDSLFASIDTVENGWTPLMAAQWFGTSEMMKYLVQAGVNVNEQRLKSGKTVLIHAALWGRVEDVEYLLAHGADKNIIDKEGRKAIDYTKDYDKPWTLTEERKNEWADKLKKVEELLLNYD